MPAITISTIPPQILAQIQKPPLLKGESAQEYYDMFGGLVSDIAPVGFVEWLWLIQFLDCAWEILRNRRYRAALIDLHQTEAFCSMLKKSRLNTSPSDDYARREFNRWTQNPYDFVKHGISPDSVPALAFVHSATSLDVIDKSLERLVRRSDSIVQQLEYRREMFAHRARRTADKVLNADNFQHPRLASPDASHSLEPTDMTPSPQTSSDEVAITPAASLEAGRPTPEAASAETSTPTDSV